MTLKQSTGSPLYRVDDWGDQRITSRIDGQSWGFISRVDGAQTGIYRPQWDSNGGAAFADADGMAVPDGSASEEAVETPTDLTVGRWKFDFKFETEPTDNAGDTAFFYPLWDSSNNNIQFQITDSDDNVRLRVVEGGANNDIATTTASFTTLTTVEIVRGLGGQLELFIDGSSIGSGTDDFVPPTLRSMRFMNKTDARITVESFEAIGLASRF